MATRYVPICWHISINDVCTKMFGSIPHGWGNIPKCYWCQHWNDDVSCFLSNLQILKVFHSYEMCVCVCVCVVNRRTICKGKRFRGLNVISLAYKIELNNILRKVSKNYYRWHLLLILLGNIGSLLCKEVLILHSLFVNGGSKYYK